MLLRPSGNRLAARFNPKLVEWGMIPAVLTIPFVLAGLAYAFALIADIIHRPYG
jgi:hypothetical protein